VDHAVTPSACIDTLVKPSWDPPAWLFGPMWTILYIMIALAAFRLLQDAGWARGRWSTSCCSGWCMAPLSCCVGESHSGARCCCCRAGLGFPLRRS
jgi:heme A synthase